MAEKTVNTYITFPFNTNIVDIRITFTPSAILHMTEIVSSPSMYAC